MLDDEHLLLAVSEAANLGQRLPVLLLLSHVEQPAAPSRIRDKGLMIGFRKISKWNLTDVLGKAAKDDQVAQLTNGWKLLSPGMTRIERYYKSEGAMISEVRHALRGHLASISNEQRRLFVNEAIKSFDVKAYRAAVVLSWVGAVHILQEYIALNHVKAFNDAGIARQTKAAARGINYTFLPVRTTKDFGVIGESDMLQLCQDAGILHKAEKQLLQDRLDLRNQCGHPNPITIAEHTVAHHIEILMLNVYSRY